MTPKPANKPIIAVDIDDVLAPNAEGFVEFSNKRWGTKLKVTDYNEHWAVLWQVDEHEMENRTHEFIVSGVPNEYIPKSGANEALKLLSRKYKLVIVTSRRKAYASDTTAWLDKHFSKIFSEIHYVGIWDKISRDRVNQTKGEYARQIGADYLIDDQLKHCESAAKAGIESLLFGNYPWNQADKLPNGVTRVKNWREVLEYFEHERRS